MGAAKKINHEALSIAARDPANTLGDLAAQFQVSVTCIKSRLLALGIDKVKGEKPKGREAAAQGLSPDATPISAFGERQAELEQLQPWPEGIWFG